jgi:hypothetical protein
VRGMSTHAGDYIEVVLLLTTTGEVELLMPFFKTVTVVSATAAGLSVLALPMWALGVPGVENDYARGWKMGLHVLLIYPVAWLVNYAPHFLLRKKLSSESRLSWQNTTGSIVCVVFALATARMVQAFKTML